MHCKWSALNWMSLTLYTRKDVQYYWFLQIVWTPGAMPSKPSKVSFFLESINTLEQVINVLAHGGWSVSVVSVVKMVRSLTVEWQEIIWELSKDGLCTLAYDNLDFDFKLKEATLENPGTFESITTGTFISLGHGTMLDDLHFSNELWRKSPLNPQGTNDVTPSQSPSLQYILKQMGESIPHTEQSESNQKPMPFRLHNNHH